MAATSETTLSWLNVSLQNFDFKEPDDFSSVGLRFDDSFNKNDEGQLQTRITEIYETELMKGLRAKASERKTDIPNEFHEYYDTCKKHCFETFKSLLESYLSNVKRIQKLAEKNAAQEPLDFFNLRVPGTLNFGSQMCMKKCAAACDTKIATKLAALSLEIQRDVQLAREEAQTEIEKELKSCKDTFMEYGKDEWIKLCQKAGSTVNILDQMYTARGETIHEEPIAPLDSDDDSEFARLHTVKRRIRKPSYTKMSTFIYGLAIFDCRSDINTLICDRRADLLRSKDDAATRKSKQDLVNATALSSKPEEILSKKFERMEKRHDNSEKRIIALESSQEPPAHRLTTSTNRDEKDILRRLERLEKLEALNRHYSDDEDEYQKNVSGADSAEQRMSMGAPKRARLAAQKTTNTIATTTPLMTRTTIPPRNGSQSGNGRGLTVRVQRSSTGGRHVRDADGAEEATNYDSTTPPPRHTPWRARGGRGGHRGGHRGRGRGY